MRYKVVLTSTKRRKRVEFMVMGENLQEIMADLKLEIFEMKRTSYPNKEGHHDARRLIADYDFVL